MNFSNELMVNKFFVKFDEYFWYRFNWYLFIDRADIIIVIISKLLNQSTPSFGPSTGLIHEECNKFIVCSVAYCVGNVS